MQQKSSVGALYHWWAIIRLLLAFGDVYLDVGINVI